MRFLYKIYSNYDGFTPRRIPERMREGRFLELGWARYLDEVSKADECWVYFHGRHAFKPGVYVKGYIADVDRGAGSAVLRVREFDTQRPLTDDETGERISEAVSIKYRQVFLWPDQRDIIPQCSVEACLRRLCENCDTWRSMSVIDPAHVSDAASGADQTCSAYWVIPSRCYLYSQGKRPANWVTRATHMFGEFKLGERRYSYPLALGMFFALRLKDMLDYDALIPIPLSPDKAAAGELHRTRALAHELGRLLGSPVRECLSLAQPISKRRMQAEGESLATFRRRYYGQLQIGEPLDRLHRILLVDDAVTHGATLACAVRRLKAERPDLRVDAVTAARMITKASVANEDGVLE